MLDKSGNLRGPFSFFIRWRREKSASKHCHGLWATQLLSHPGWQSGSLLAKAAILLYPCLVAISKCVPSTNSKLACEPVLLPAPGGPTSAS